MSLYRKIEVTVWDDERFIGLSDRGKLLFLLMLSHPNMTMLGAMRASPATLAEDLRWAPETIREPFREVLAKGFAKADEKARLIVLPNFLKYNRPANPNVVKSWGKVFLALPDCKLKRELAQRVVAFVETLPKGFAEGLPLVFRNQEQEQEQRKTLSKRGAKASEGTAESGLAVVIGGRS